MLNKNLLLISILSIILTACGGGGGGSSSSASQNTNIIQNLSTAKHTQVGHSERFINFNTPQEKLQTSQVVFSDNTKELESAQDLNQITFRGISINLIPSEAKTEKAPYNRTGLFVFNEIGEDFAVGYINSPNLTSKFGLVADDRDDEDFYTSAFSQGFITPVNNMPINESNVLYKGYYLTRISHTEDGVAYDGTMSATANFANKTLTVNLSSHPFSPARIINNTITGNTFKSSNNNMRGNFYGNRAQELGGVYSEEGSNDEQEILAFGATCLPNCR